jgi:hypothetical protein
MPDEPIRCPRPSRRMACLVSALALAAGCGSPPPAAAPAAAGSASPAPSGSGKADAKAPKSMDPPGLVGAISGSYLIPELTPEKGVFLREEGHKKILVDRMRIIAHEDGSEERATELMPNSYASAIALPSRLGGGFLFHSSGGGTTQIWRAASWLAHLEPLTQVSTVADEIIPGFDRLYVRLQSSNRLVAIDPQTGATMPLGPLPPSVAYGALAFADGWRAVVDTDLRGPLATFDAGTTWRPLRLPERPGTITAITGDPVLFVNGGSYLVDASGAMTFRPDPPRKYSTDKDRDQEEAKAARPPGPLGKRPLRAALEDGFPEGGRTAIVARGGALARVSLRDGSVVKIVPEAYKDRDASCHAVRVGQGWGFVCGERDGATTVQAFVPPFSLKEIWRFAKPRFVSPSGNGALVMRGPCDDEPVKAGDGRTYCIRAADGATRQIRVTGDLGVERVIALADGRVVVLVPPRREAGQITVLRGVAVESSAPLKFPNRPSDSARAAKRGLWLDGFEEREPGVIGGWVEAGGAVVGVRVSLNGEMKLGEMRTDPNGALVAGRFGVSIGDDGEAAETTDGGMEWTTFELPDHEVDTPARTRACGPVGCALASWLRVGWGKPLVKDDFETAKPPGSPYAPITTASTVTMSCELLGSVTPPLPEKPATKDPKAKTPPNPRQRYGYPYGYGYGGYGYGYGYGYKPPWMAFRNTAAPTLGKDETGVDTGSYGASAQLRSYTWGKKGSDWTKAGKWLVRFDDRFDVGGGVRSSAITAPPWADEQQAIGGVTGGMSYGVASWSAYLDPSGRAALGQACNGPCALYSISEGQPVLAMRDGSGRFGGYSRLLATGSTTAGTAVRVGESWFFLTSGPQYDSIALWRADLGVIKQLGVYYRPSKSRYASIEPPRLVRRALGTSLGLLVTAPKGPGEPSSTWYVLPVDSETGALDEPISLGRRDLSGAMPERCAAGQDGWLTEAFLETSPSVDLGTSYAQMDSVEMRLRIDPGSVCVEAISAGTDGTVAVAKKGPGPAKGAPAGKPKDVDPHKVPLALTERLSGTRWVFQCGPQEKAPVAPVVPTATVTVVPDDEER